MGGAYPARWGNRRAAVVSFAYLEQPAQAQTRSIGMRCECGV